MRNREFYEQEGFAVTCRSLEEYTRMFAVQLEAGAEVLDAAGGASSFGVGVRALGLAAISVDPTYALEPEAMERKALTELNEAADKLDALRDKFDWSYYGSLEEHTRKREESVRLFLDDYRERFGTEAYTCASLPSLPFDDGRFSHVFCSHFLFLYAEQLSYHFHRAALMELVRVLKPGGELRIYPLLDLKRTPYPQLEELMQDLQHAGLSPELMRSELPFIPGSDCLLRVRKPVQAI